MVALISDVRIALDGAEGRTDMNGSAEFMVDGGTYRVTVSKSGYDPLSFSLTVDRDMTVEVTLEAARRESLIPPILFTGVGVALVAMAM